jgi:5,10-methylenetetrahydromethanopterin reductase
VTDRLGAYISIGRGRDQALERVRLVESLGYDSVWINHLMGFDAMTAAAAYAVETTTIGIGTGVVPILTRHPAVMAQEAASIDALSDGRFSLGIGVSHRVTMEDMMGLELLHPADQMREYLTVVASLLRTGSVNFEGEYYRVNFGFGGLERPRPEQPVLIAALAPRMLEVAGALADGVVLWLAAPAYIRDTVVPIVSAAREKAGKTMEGFEIVAAVPAALTGNVAAAHDTLRAFLVTYCSLPFYRHMLEASGFGPDLERFDAEGPSGISDAMIDAIAGVGDAAAVCAAVQRYRDAGATTPAVGPLAKHDGYAGPDETFRIAIAD